MATSSGASNQPFTPAAGQLFQGAKVFAAPEINSGRATFAGGFQIGGNTPTVTIQSGAGTVGAISLVNGYDQACNFRLVAGTAALNGGTLATVVFGTPFDVAPISVIATAVNAAGTIGLACGAASLATTGFSIVGNAPASGGTYAVNYFVVRSPL